MATKPLDQLSPKYRQRIESGLRRALTRSQSRGHAKPTELPATQQTVINKTRGAILPRKPTKQSIHFQQIKNEIVESDNYYFVFNDYKFVGDLSDFENEEGELDSRLFTIIKSFLKGKKHKLYRIAATVVGYGTFTEGKTIGTGYEILSGTHNIDYLGQFTEILTLYISFKDTIKKPGVK